MATVARALEGEVDEEANKTGDDIELYATTTTNSTMNISFSPSIGTTNISYGTPTKVQVTATVNIKNSGGYTIYFGSNSQNLTRVGGNETIAPTTGNLRFTALENNTWGYAIEEGNTVSDAVLYTAMPGSIRGRELYTNHSPYILDDTKTYTLSFAARIGTDKPAGTYSNVATLSVVSSPFVVTNDFGVSTMQEMTSSVCANAQDDDGDGIPSGQLRDTRDNKYYWVGKLADDNCWMLQNLSLDLGTSWPEASKSDYATASTAYAPTATQTAFTSVSAATLGTRSWNFGEWVITDPTASSSCGSTLKTGLSTCTAQFTQITPGMKPSANPTFYKDNGNKTVVGNEYDAHYLVGNYYQWNTATAGSGGKITSGVPSSSICPKGWKLPTTSDFSTLVSKGGINNATKFVGDGYFFVKGGNIHQNASSLFNGAGSTGYYWTSTPNSYSSGEYAYYLYFTGSDVYPSTSNYYSTQSYRSNGYSVRCVAR